MHVGERGAAGRNKPAPCLCARNSCNGNTQLLQIRDKRYSVATCCCTRAGACLHKLSVFATANFAYAFLLREAGTILRLSWLPFLLVTIIQYFAMRAQLDAIRSTLEGGDIQALLTVSPPWRSQILAAVAMILGIAIVAVALHRIILFGDRQPECFVYLAFGKIEALFALLPIVLILAMGLGFLGLSAIAVATSQVPIFFFLVWLCVWVASAVLIVRLALIFPVTVVEGRYDFGQAWALTRGNFWRILALWIVVFIPVLIIAGVLFAVIGFSTVASRVDVRDQTSMLIELMESLLFVQTIIGYVWLVIGSALGVAVLSYSYKALSGRQPDDFLTPRV